MNRNTGNEIQVQENGVTIFSMREVSSPSALGVKIEPVYQRKIFGMVSPILSSLSNISKSIDGIKTYEAVFSSKAKELLKDGTAVIQVDKEGKLLPQIVHTGKKGSKGKIIEKARLKSGVTPANIALLAWQVASMITAQKYLADINKQLQHISHNVQDIKDFLEEDLYAQINSKINSVKHLFVCISRNPDFFQEFERFHAGKMAHDMENVDVLLQRVTALLGYKIRDFSKKQFKEREISKARDRYKKEIQEIFSFMQLILNLVQAQHILCMIYALYAENSNYADEWRRTLAQRKEEFLEKMRYFKKVAEEKVRTIDDELPWWEIGIACVVIPLATPFVAAKELLAAFDVTESIFNSESNVDKARRLQRKDNFDNFFEFENNVENLFLNMENQAKSLSGEYCLAIELRGGILKI